MALARGLIRAAALWLLATAAAAQELPALYRVTGVAADDVLNVRAEPDAGAERIGALPPAAAGVEVVELAAGRRWGRVNLAGTSGWVSMRYMAHEGGPDWRSLAAPLSCFGTEPFWGLDIAAGAAEASYSGLVIAPRALGPAEVWPGPIFGAPSVGLLFGGQAGFAAIRGETCDDGMSDKLYGLSILLFLRDRGEGGAGGLSGCCTLER